MGNDERAIIGGGERSTRRRGDVEREAMEALTVSLVCVSNLPGVIC